VRWVTRSARAAKILAAMTLWMLIVPFAFYRRGALESITSGWLQRTVVMAILVLGLMVTLKDVTRLMDTIAVAATAAALIGLSSGSVDLEGRLRLQGTIANPNDLAFAILVGVGPWLCFMQRSGAVRKFVGGAAIVPIFPCFLCTGSRGGLLGLAAMALVGFLRVRAEVKLKLGVAGLVALACAALVLPPRLKERFPTFNSAASDDPDATVTAVESTEQRKRILIQSLKIVAVHPVFGVGMNNSQGAENAVARAEGRRKGDWRGSHNTYTQIAAECGVPVLAMLLYLLGSSIRGTAVTRRWLAAVPGQRAAQLAAPALAMEVPRWNVAVHSFFLHRGFDMMLYLLIGLGVVVARCADQEVAAAAGAAPVAPLYAPPECRATVCATPFWPRIASGSRETHASASRR
jgi:O-antigen ligase